MILSSLPQAQAQFILDPCLVPSILALCNQYGKELFDHVYYITRTYAYYMHRAKMISLGRWPGDPGRKPKIITNQKSKPRSLTLQNISNPYLDHLIHFSVAGTTDHDKRYPGISGPTYCLTSCSPVVRVLVYQPSGPGSIPGMSRSETAITRGKT